MLIIGKDRFFVVTRLNRVPEDATLVETGGYELRPSRFHSDLRYHRQEAVSTMCFPPPYAEGKQKLHRKGPVPLHGIRLAHLQVKTCETSGWQANLLHAMGVRGTVTRTNLAYAKEHRSWEVYFELAQILMSKARKL